MGRPSNMANLEGTKLVEQRPYPAEDLTGTLIRKPLQNLRTLFEELHRNTTLGLFSIRGLVYLEPQPSTIAKTFSYNNTFTYNQRALLLTYGIAAILGLLAVIIGLKTLFNNGVSMKAGFLTFMATTRNQTLDELAKGACLGGEPVPSSLRKVRVRFGDVTREDWSKVATGAYHGGGGEARARHAAFGVEGEVADIRYRELYS
jgi:hypothetical protein